MSDSPELLKPDTVTNSELQIELGNLQAENEKLQNDYATLLESHTVAADKLREEVQQLRSQLATERADREEIEAQLADLKQKSATTGKEFPDEAEVYNQFKAGNPKAKATYKETVAILATARAMIEKS